MRPPISLPPNVNCSILHSISALGATSLEGFKMNKLIMLAISVGLMTSGCAVQKEYVASGGNRGAGTLKLSYEVMGLQEAKVNNGAALETARRRCQSWGYTDAEAFDMVSRTCQMPGGLTGCQQWLVTKEFQCLGSLK
jgi:YecR-like lipoprotein